MKDELKELYIKKLSDFLIKKIGNKADLKEEIENDDYDFQELLNLARKEVKKNDKKKK